MSSRRVRPVPRHVPIAVLACLVLAGGSAVAEAPSPAERVRVPDPTVSAGEVAKRLSRYVHVEVGPSLKKLDARTLQLLRKLVEASEHVERAYWDQVSPDGFAMAEELDARGDTASRDLATFLRVNYGPWDRLAGHAPFLGPTEKPEGASLYPHDASRREIEKWIADHPADRDAFLSPYTVVRRSNGALAATPYSKAFREPLGRAAAALREAAGLTDCPGLAKFLAARADALVTDDYSASEMAWMDTGACRVDAAIGPYEFYEDRLMGFKTVFSSVVTVTDEAATAKLAKLSSYAPDLLKQLPLAGEGMADRFEAVKPSGITVADEVFAAGDARAGFQIRAYILPNDEKVRVARGTKHVILRNVVEQRFNYLLKPIAKAVLPDDHVEQVDFGSYFDTLLMWQLAHGFAPKSVVLPGGGRVPPRVLLRQRYGIIEAARAEAISLLNGFLLVDKGVFHTDRERSIPVTWLASLFESIRAGTAETHGIAKLVVYNKLAEADAFRYDPATRRFSVNPERIRPVVRELVGVLLSIELNGDYDAAGRLIVDYGLVPAEVRGKLDEIAGLPVDILPHYTVRALPR
ncbi:MAG: hypothetical protein FJ087_10575 [Deltaproteobacteria bacterium]|nr:hypothetical protein [Deltaproteobacteria bacterium]